MVSRAASETLVTEGDGDVEILVLQLVAEHEQFDISIVHRAMSGAQRAADEVIR